MNSRDRVFGGVLVTIVFLVGIAVVFSGCKKEEPVAQPQVSQSAVDHDHPSEHPSDHPHETAAQEATGAAQEASEEVTAQVVAVTEQTTCPVMDGNPINKDLFVEYKGKKVYFCCKGCEEKFLADPAQYVAKLPQFQDQK